MRRFAQHTRIRATAGRRDALVAKFLEVSVVQRDNPACELSVVSTSPDDPDVVFVIEVWTSEAAHTAARESADVALWAADMPELVAGTPDTQRLAIVGGKGLR